MTRFRILLAALFLIAGTGVALAQQTAEAMAAADTEWMAETLNLDQQQVEQIRQINLDYAQKTVTLKSSDIDQAAMKEQHKELVKARHEQFKEVLTEEQYATYKAKWKEKQDGASD